MRTNFCYPINTKIFNGFRFLPVGLTKASFPASSALLRFRANRTRMPRMCCQRFTFCKIYNEFLCPSLNFLSKNSLQVRNWCKKLWPKLARRKLSRNREPDNCFLCSRKSSLKWLGKLSCNPIQTSRVKGFHITYKIYSVMSMLP